MVRLPFNKSVIGNSLERPRLSSAQEIFFQVIFQFGNLSGIAGIKFFGSNGSLAIIFLSDGLFSGTRFRKAARLLVPSFLHQNGKTPIDRTPGKASFSLISRGLIRLLAIDRLTQPFYTKAIMTNRILLDKQGPPNQARESRAFTLIELRVIAHRHSREHELPTLANSKKRAARKCTNNLKQLALEPRYISMITGIIFPEPASNTYGFHVED
jgi:hypothetical protein